MSQPAVNPFFQRQWSSLVPRFAMKVARLAEKTADSQAVADIMAAHGFNPVERLILLIDEEIEAPEDEGIQKSMLCTDYEPSPNRPGHFRYRARLRGEWIMEAMRYLHARKKATDETKGGAVAIVVEIKNYANPDVTVLETRDS